MTAIPLQICGSVSEPLPETVPSSTIRFQPTAGEFFAGVGLVRMALEENYCRVVFANDIDLRKKKLYELNFGSPCLELVTCDIREVQGSMMSSIDIATASFPCTDTSVAGKRAGLEGSQSRTFYEFVRILRELGSRKPRAILIENVLGFVSVRDGADFRHAVRILRGLGYQIDLLYGDAKWFLPQSRPRLFIIGILGNYTASTDIAPTPWRPSWLTRLMRELELFPLKTPTQPNRSSNLVTLLQCDDQDADWWDERRTDGFIRTLGKGHYARLMLLLRRDEIDYVTAYRRTRAGRAVWEIRCDGVAGCLRTMRGGSSRQALIAVGKNCLKIRWMSVKDCARLQGAPDFKYDVERPHDALFALGDGVCVPVVSHILREYIRPALEID